MAGGSLLPEFSLKTVDLRRLQAILDPLAADLAAYQEWVEHHGYKSLTTVEAMLNSIYDGNSDLRKWVEEHQEWAKQANTVDVGLYSLVEILGEAAEKIYDSIPNDPKVQDDRPGFIRVPRRKKPFHFEAVVVSQVEMAAETVRGWQAELTPDKQRRDEEQIGSLEWSKPITKKDLEGYLVVSRNTLKTRLTKGSKPVEGKIRYRVPNEGARKIEVVVTDLPAEVQAKLRKRATA